MAGCKQEFAAYAHGTKGSAVISSSGHVPARSRTYAEAAASYYLKKVDARWGIWKIEYKE